MLLCGLGMEVEDGARGAGSGGAAAGRASGALCALCAPRPSFWGVWSCTSFGTLTRELGTVGSVIIINGLCYRISGA